MIFVFIYQDETKLINWIIAKDMGRFKVFYTMQPIFLINQLLR